MKKILSKLDILLIVEPYASLKLLQRRMRSNKLQSDNDTNRKIPENTRFSGILVETAGLEPAEACLRLLSALFPLASLAQRAFGAGRSLVRDQRSFPNKDTAEWRCLCLVETAGLEPVTSCV